MSNTAPPKGTRAYYRAEARRKDKRAFKYTTDNAIYDTVKKLQATLKPDERSLLIKQFASSLDRYESLALTLYPVRRHLYAIYTKRVTDKLATSTLSKKFNMSIQGHNKDVGAVVDEQFQLAFDHEIAGRSLEAAKALKKVGLRHSILYGEEIASLVRAAGLEDALTELTRTEQYRDILWRSCLRMAVRLAKRHAAPLKGSIIEEADLVQEALIGAQEGVKSYEPSEDGRTFTSFMYNWVNGTLSKYINEHTRTVSLPRSTIDRFRVVQKVVEEVGDTDNLTLLTAQANRLLAGMPGSKEQYTEEEVATLLLRTQDNVSLDCELDSDENAHPLTLTDLLPVHEESETEAKLDKHYAMSRILAVLQEYTNNEEYNIMQRRWGSGAVKGLKTVADEYRAEEGSPMNKGRVADIETRVFDRLRRAAQNGDIRLLDILDSLREAC